MVHVCAGRVLSDGCPGLRGHFGGLVVCVAGGFGVDRSRSVGGHRCRGDVQGVGAGHDVHAEIPVMMAKTAVTKAARWRNSAAVRRAVEVKTYLL